MIEQAQRVRLEHLDFVLTVDEQDRRLRDATVILEHDRIVAVEHHEEVARRHPRRPSDCVVDARNFGMVPGFVDTHVHLSETLSRGAFPDDISTRTWVYDWVMPYYGHLSHEDEQVAVRVGMLEMLRAGTTCFLDMGAINDAAITVEAAVELGIRGITGRHAADTPPSRLPERWWPKMVEKHFFPDSKTALDLLEETVKNYNGAGGGRVGCWVNIQGKEPCSAELHVGARALAERLGVGTTYHIASSLKEAEIYGKRYGCWPVTRIDRLAGLGSNLVLAHAVAVTQAEVERLVDEETKVAFCPGTSLKLAKGATSIGRYPEMCASGVTVGLGTDGVSASGNLHLVRQLYLVAGLFKDARADATTIGAERALRMATIDGARALRLEDQIGSLEVGKKADFVLFDTSHPEWTPYEDPTQALVWSASAASIAETWVDGSCVYRGGNVRTVPYTNSLYQEARERAHRLAGLISPKSTFAPSSVYE
jgi:5-methylthioadenosine/S-adenosylhomocysteine deaminase